MQPCRSLPDLPAMEASVILSELRGATKTGRKIDFFGVEPWIRLNQGGLGELGHVKFLEYSKKVLIIS
jgi:hypothetical protein